MHVQGCLILSQVGLLFPVNHAPIKLASLTGFAPVISCNVYCKDSTDPVVVETVDELSKFTGSYFGE